MVFFGFRRRRNHRDDPQEDRLFYGDLVFGVNFGTDTKGCLGCSSNDLWRWKKYLLGGENGSTVDGQNPAPPRMMIIPLFIGC